jgi:hypothetical protein
VVQAKLAKGALSSSREAPGTARGLREGCTYIASHCRKAIAALLLRRSGLTSSLGCLTAMFEVVLARSDLVEGEAISQAHRIQSVRDGACEVVMGLVMGLVIVRRARGGNGNDQQYGSYYYATTFMQLPRSGPRSFHPACRSRLRLPRR